MVIAKGPHQQTTERSICYSVAAKKTRTTAAWQCAVGIVVFIFVVGNKPSHERAPEHPTAAKEKEETAC
jgi:hypothetical protein